MRSRCLTAGFRLFAELSILRWVKLKKHFNKTIVVLNEIDENSILSEYEKRRKATENSGKKVIGYQLSVIGFEHLNTDYLITDYPI